MTGTETQRQQKLEDLRQLIDWLSAHPDVPLGYGDGLSHHIHADDDEAGIAAVTELAERIGVPVTDTAGGPVTAATAHFHAAKRFGSAEYSAVYITKEHTRRYREHMKPYNEANIARRKATVSS